MHTDDEFVARWQETTETVRSWLRRHRLSVQDIEEITQEIAIRMLRNRTTVDLTRMTPLAINTARWLLIDRIRSAKQEQRAYGRLAAAIDDSENSSWAPGERRAYMAQALSHLSPREREVLERLFIDGKTPRQVAALMSLSPATVRSLLRHARVRLAAFLFE